MLGALLQVLGAVVLTLVVGIGGALYLFFTTGSPERDSAGIAHQTPPVSDGGSPHGDVGGDGLESVLRDIAASVDLSAIAGAIKQQRCRRPSQGGGRQLGTVPLGPAGCATFTQSIAGGPVTCELVESAQWLERLMEWAATAVGHSVATAFEEGQQPSLGDLAHAMGSAALLKSVSKLRTKFLSDALDVRISKLRIGEVPCGVEHKQFGAPKAPSLGGGHIATQYAVDLEHIRKRHNVEVAGGTSRRLARVPAGSQALYVSFPLSWCDADLYLRLSGVFPLLLSKKTNEKFCLASDFITLAASAAVTGFSVGATVRARIVAGGPHEDPDPDRPKDAKERVLPLVTIDLTFTEVPIVNMSLDATLGDDLVEVSSPPTDVAHSEAAPLLPALTLSTSGGDSQHRLRAHASAPKVPTPTTGRSVGQSKVTQLARLQVSHALERLTFPNVTRLSLGFVNGKHKVSTRRIVVPEGEEW